MTSMFISVDTVGETTQQVYKGQFEVKLFLTHKEKGNVTREANKYTQGLQRTPRWDVQGFLSGLRDEWENTQEADKLKLTEEQIARVLTIAAISIPIGDAEADIFATIALLNGHIVTAPEWWGRSNANPGGYELVDYKPVVELFNELKKLQELSIKKE